MPAASYTTTVADTSWPSRLEDSRSVCMRLSVTHVRPCTHSCSVQSSISSVVDSIPTREMTTTRPSLSSSVYSPPMAVILSTHAGGFLSISSAPMSRRQRSVSHSRLYERSTRNARCLPEHSARRNRSIMRCFPSGCREQRTYASGSSRFIVSSSSRSASLCCAVRLPSYPVRMRAAHCRLLAVVDGAAPASPSSSSSPALAALKGAAGAAAAPRTRASSWYSE